MPDNPGAWLMATAKHRAIDRLRHGKLQERKHEELGHEIETARSRRISTPHSTMTSATTCCA